MVHQKPLRSTPVLAVISFIAIAAVFIDLWKLFFFFSFPALMVDNDIANSLDEVGL